MSIKIQYGVIPYLKKNKKDTYPKIILITSRTNGYWIFPKGNPIKKKDSYQSAEQEAFEEAGVIGEIDESLSYKVFFKQGDTDHTTILYPMKVKEILDDWPEKDERERRIVSMDKAMNLITLKPIQEALKIWEKDHATS